MPLARLGTILYQLLPLSEGPGEVWAALATALGLQGPLCPSPVHLLSRALTGLQPRSLFTLPDLSFTPWSECSLAPGCWPAPPPLLVSVPWARTQSQGSLTRVGQPSMGSE